MRVVVELVPRDLQAIEAQLVEVEELQRVAAVNLPDLTRFALRSWQAAAEVRRVADGRWPVIAHVRAMDVDLTRPWPPLARLDAAGVEEVLVITGDPPFHPDYPMSGAHVLDVIRMIKRERPAWRVYAALDPYRTGFAQERDTVQRKLDAGVDAFFTQPFFDLRLMAVWHDLMGEVPVYWGITSVVSERTQRYWLTRNRAVFPSSFRPTLDWHRRFAAAALAFAEEHDTHLYFMPIRVSIRAWLRELLG